jgi:S1-C subfamily serine protease
LWFKSCILNWPSRQLAESFALETNERILVAQVIHNSPADEASMKIGGIIISFQNESVSINSFISKYRCLKPTHSKALLKVMRDGKQVKFTVTMGKLAKPKNRHCQMSHLVKNSD